MIGPDDKVTRKEFIVDAFERTYKAQELFNASWVDEGKFGHHTRPIEECYIEAAGGDVIFGTWLYLINYRQWDLEHVAAHYGISPEGPVPPAPSIYASWDEGEWKVWSDDDSKVKEGPAT